MEGNIKQFITQTHYASDALDLHMETSAEVRPVNEVYRNGELFKTNSINLVEEQGEVSEPNLTAFYQRMRNEDGE